MGEAKLRELHVGVIGAGNMGGTILEGLLDTGVATPERLLVSDPRRERREQLLDELGVASTGSNLEVARFADLLVLATKLDIDVRISKTLKADLRGSFNTDFAADVYRCLGSARPSSLRFVVNACIASARWRGIIS